MIFQMRPIMGFQLPAYPAYVPEKKETPAHEKAIAELEWLRSTLGVQRQVAWVKTSGYENAFADGKGIVERLSFEDKARVAGHFSKIRPRNEKDREFIYAMLCLSAPYLEAMQLEEDVRLKPEEFRKKNGKYHSTDNNCRHYIFKKMHENRRYAFPEAFGKKLGKNVEGRPEKFDWKGAGWQIDRLTATEFKALDSDTKRQYLRGEKAAFVKIRVDDDSKIAEMLKPGDIVWVSLSPNPQSVTAHVGAYTGRPLRGSRGEVKLPIVNIAKPLKASDYGSFVARTRRRGGEVYILRWAATVAAEEEIRMPEKKLAFGEMKFKAAEQDALRFAPRKFD